MPEKIYSTFQKSPGVPCLWSNPTNFTATFLKVTWKTLSTVLSILPLTVRKSHNFALYDQYDNGYDHDHAHDHDNYNNDDDDDDYDDDDDDDDDDDNGAT